jgi:subtilase family serine protease
MKLLALTILTLMILATAPSFAAAAAPEWQAQPMYKVKAQEVDPNSMGANAPYYAPLDIREAYKIPLTGDSGTIAIIEAYDNPKAAADLATFCSVFNWPTANLEIHKMSQFIAPNAGWALESNLDIQWAHAVAPHAKILLVEAKSNSIVDLIAAVDYANSRSDVVAVSMSWGANENSGQLAYDSHFTTNGKTYFASAGDVGGVVSWPSSSTNVVSVGGTTLTMTTDGYTETAWSSGGGGVSTIEPVPIYQTSLGFNKRATPDVAYNGDPSTGFLVYDSYGYNGGRGWFIVGGTSAGAPQWAAINTFTKSATNTNFYSNYPISYGATFTDITSGSNGYPTQTNYDLATGIGSPIGVNFAAPPTPDFSIAASPSTVTITTATNPTGTTSITVGSIGAFTNEVTLSASDSSNKLTLNLSPSVITGGSGPSTLTITVPPNTPAGTYPITVQGSSDSKVHTMTIDVQVLNPDFSITAAPSTVIISTATSNGKATINVNSIGGFSKDVVLTTTDDNNVGLKIKLDPQTVPSGSKSSTMIITLPAGIAAGTYPITIQGTDGTTTHTASVNVQVVNPSFGLTANPTSLNIRRGNTATSTIAVNSINGYSGTPTLTVTGNPTSMTVQFKQNTGGSSTMTVTVSRTANTGTYTLTIKGTDGALISTAQVKVTVSR